MDYTNKNFDEATKSKLSSIEEQFINMRATGQTVRQIARKLKKSTQTICDLNKKYFRQISDIRNEKLEVLQKRMYEQKQERLDFLSEQLQILKENAKENEVFLNYERSITLAIKISLALNKCERDMQISDLLINVNPSGNLEQENEYQETQEISETNVSDEKTDNPLENKEVKNGAKTPGNTETKNKKSKTRKDKKTEINKPEQNTLDTANDEKIVENQNPQDEPPPRTKADFYRRVLKNKNAAPIPKPPT